MSENKLHDLIIAGGGTAVLTAGVYAKRAALKTVLIGVGHIALKGTLSGAQRKIRVPQRWPNVQHEGFSDEQNAK